MADTLRGAVPIPTGRTPRLAAALAALPPTRTVAATPPWPDYIRTGRSEVCATERQEQARRAADRKGGTR